MAHLLLSLVAITAGTAIGEAREIIESEEGRLVGMAVASDRMETVTGKDGENERERAVWEWGGGIIC